MGCFKGFASAKVRNEERGVRLSFIVSEIIAATGARLAHGSLGKSASSISIDTRTMKKRAAFIAIKGDRFDGHDFIATAIKRGAACIITERRLRLPLPCGVASLEVKNTVSALGALAKAWREKFSIPVIGVTGSNGKTTTKDMIAQVLSKRLCVLKNEGTKNNHIGVPLTLLNLHKNHDVAVLELGTNHPGEIAYLADIAGPTCGVITTIGPAHLEHFGTISGVMREKYALVERLRRPAIALLNADDDALRQRLLQKNGRIFHVGFGIKHRADFFASRLSHEGSRISFLLNYRTRCIVRTPGEHNIYNALCAAAVGRMFGLSYPEISSCLESFRFPPGRLEPARRKKVFFLNDSYNANPQSLHYALRALARAVTRGKKIFVMGDMLELGRRAKEFHAQAGKQAAAICDCLIAVGTLARTAAASARAAGLPRRNIFLCSSSRRAASLLHDRIKVGKDDIVLVKGSRAMKMEEVIH